jgi:hypothetical protein
MVGLGDGVKVGVGLGVAVGVEVGVAVGAAAVRVAAAARSTATWVATGSGVGVGVPPQPATRHNATMRINQRFTFFPPLLNRPALRMLHHPGKPVSGIVLSNSSERKSLSQNRGVSPRRVGERFLPRIARICTNL